MQAGCSMLGVDDCNGYKYAVLQCSVSVLYFLTWWTSYSLPASCGVVCAVLTGYGWITLRVTLCLPVCVTFPPVYGTLALY